MVNADWSLTQSACNHIILYRAQLIGSCSVSNQWAHCSASNTLSAFVAVQSTFRNPPPSPVPPVLICYG